ncbi:MAG TPA: hypothetical protein VJU61_18350 [Polyangiaceae bacterium]|nr:hypothetical protein [Polyangiaceae bacterium]
MAAPLHSFGCSEASPGDDTSALSGSCVAAPKNDISISFVSIPGQGNWPEELVPGLNGASRVAPTPSGTGCEWTDLGYYGSQSIRCSGQASVVPAANEGEFEATFAGGAVARFSMPGAELPASGELQLELDRSSRKSNPFGGLSVSSSSVARDTAGQLVWLVAPDADEQLAELVGARIQTVRSCRTRFEDCQGVFERTVFDHVVQTTPEQRIAAAEPTLIDTPSGTYLITWYSAEIEQKAEQICEDADFPPSQSGVRALLQR